MRAKEALYLGAFFIRYHVRTKTGLISTSVLLAVLVVVVDITYEHGRYPHDEDKDIHNLSKK